jgi:hypothetical protein
MTAPAFEAQYAAWPPEPQIPTTDAVIAIEPRLSARCGQAALAKR